MHAYTVEAILLHEVCRNAACKVAVVGVVQADASLRVTAGRGELLALSTSLAEPIDVRECE